MEINEEDGSPELNNQPKEEADKVIVTLSKRKRPTVDSLSDENLDKLMDYVDLKRVTSTLVTTIEKGVQRVKWLETTASRFDSESRLLKDPKNKSIKFTLDAFVLTWEIAINQMNKALDKTAYGAMIKEAVKVREAKKRDQEKQKKEMIKLQKKLKSEQTEKNAPKEEKNGKVESNEQITNQLAALLEEKIDEPQTDGSDYTINYNDLFVL